MEFARFWIALVPTNDFLISFLWLVWRWGGSGREGVLRRIGELCKFLIVVVKHSDVNIRLRFLSRSFQN